VGTEATDLPVVLLSHRGPVSFARDPSGRRTASRGAGGLVTALTGLVPDLPDAVWVSAASSEEDRTDPSKNIVRRFEAFATLLEDHPELAGKVSFLAMLQPSRQDVPEYADYLAEIGATVARVNAAHGREGYQPIDLRLADDLAMAVAAYTVCDVLMVNALATG
jgi:trehalose-6-phosphate synthase